MAEIFAERVPSIRYVPSGPGDTGLVLPYREKDSQTFVKNDLVFLSGAGGPPFTSYAGTVEVCGANPIQILGIAQADATNVASGHQFIPVQVIRPFDVFLMNLSSAQAATLISVGETREIIKTAAGIWEVDAENKAANLSRVRILGFGLYDSIGAIKDLTGGFPFGRAVMGRPDLATTGVPYYVKFIKLSGTATDILQFDAAAAQ